MYSLNIMINPDELIVTNPTAQDTPAPSTTPGSGPYVVQPYHSPTPLAMTPPARRANPLNVFDSPDRLSEISVARTAATGTDVSAVTSFSGHGQDTVLSRVIPQPDLNTTLPDVSTLSTSSTTRESMETTRIPISPIKARNPEVIQPAPSPVIANPSNLPPLFPAPAASLARRRSGFTGVNQLSAQALPVEQEIPTSITFNQRTSLITTENADAFRTRFGIPRAHMSPSHSPSPFGAQTSPRVGTTAVSPNNTASHSSPWGTSPSAQMAPGSTRNYRRDSSLISPIAETRSPHQSLLPSPCGAGVSPMAWTRSPFNPSPNHGTPRSPLTPFGQPPIVSRAPRAIGSVAPQVILVSPSNYALSHSPRMLSCSLSQPRIIAPAGVSLFSSSSFNDIRRSTASSVSASPGQCSGLDSVPLVLSPVSDAAPVQFNASERPRQASPTTLRQLDALRRVSRPASPAAVQVERVCSEASRSASFCTVTSTSSVRAVTESQVLATPTASAAIAPSAPITLSFSSSTNRRSAFTTSTAALSSLSNLRPL